MSSNLAEEKKKRTNIVYVRFKDASILKTLFLRMAESGQSKRAVVEFACAFAFATKGFKIPQKRPYFAPAEDALKKRKKKYEALANS